MKGSLRQGGHGHDKFGGIHRLGRVHLKSALERLRSVFRTRIRRQHGSRNLTDRDIARLSDSLGSSLANDGYQEKTVELRSPDKARITVEASANCAPTSQGAV